MLPRLLVKSQIHWLPLVDTFRTFYFNEFTDIREDLEAIKTNFIFA